MNRSVACNPENPQILIQTTSTKKSGSDPKVARPLRKFVRVETGREQENVV